MEHYYTLMKDWLFTLGTEHNVDPVLCATFYIIGKTVFVIFLGWALKNFKAKKPIFTPLLIALAGYSLPYCYLMIAGRNISIWIYLYIAAVFVYGGFTVWKKLSASSEPLDTSSL